VEIPWRRQRPPRPLLALGPSGVLPLRPRRFFPFRFQVPVARLGFASFTKPGSYSYYRLLKLGGFGNDSNSFCLSVVTWGSADAVVLFTSVILGHDQQRKVRRGCRVGCLQWQWRCWAKEYDLADKNGLADFLEHADIQLVPRARGRVMQTPSRSKPANWDGGHHVQRVAVCSSVCSYVSDTLRTGISW